MHPCPELCVEHYMGGAPCVTWMTPRNASPHNCPHPCPACNLLPPPQNGFEIYIEVHRVSLYYVITAILPIYINTCLALLVR